MVEHSACKAKDTELELPRFSALRVHLELLFTFKLKTMTWCKPQDRAILPGKCKFSFFVKYLTGFHQRL